MTPVYNSHYFKTINRDNKRVKVIYFLMFFQFKDYESYHHSGGDLSPPCHYTPAKHSRTPPGGRPGPRQMRTPRSRGRGGDFGLSITPGRRIGFNDRKYMCVCVCMERGGGVDR